jgi:hypothetical protein
MLIISNGLTGFSHVGNGLSQFEGCVVHRAPSIRVSLSRIVALIKGIRACKVCPVSLYRRTDIANPPPTDRRR